MTTNCKYLILYIDDFHCVKYYAFTVLLSANCSDTMHSPTVRGRVFTRDSSQYVWCLLMLKCALYVRALHLISMHSHADYKLASCTIETIIEDFV